MTELLEAYKTLVTAQVEYLEARDVELPDALLANCVEIILMEEFGSV